MKLVLLYGLPGVGKKTVAKKLAEKTDYKLLDNHLVLDLVRSLLPQKYPASVRIAREIRAMLLDGLIEIGEKGTVTTFAGGSAGAADTIKNWIERVEGKGGQIYFVELRADLEVIRKRIEEPDRKGGYKVMYQHELDEFLQKDYFKGIPGRESLVIDNTNLPPEECANFIIEKLGL